jgi:hypothetical protein
MGYPLIRAVTIVTNHVRTPPNAADLLGRPLDASARLINCSSRAGVERIPPGDTGPSRPTITGMEGP